MLIAIIRAPQSSHARRALILFVLVSAQAVLGISTLIFEVPIDLALSHQAGALIVLGFAIAHWRAFVGSYPAEDARPAVSR